MNSEKSSKPASNKPAQGSVENATGSTISKPDNGVQPGWRNLLAGFGLGRKATQSGKPVTPPLYRPVDWFTFIATTLLIFIAYMLTLSPDLTLEDSGELATGSMYAAVPHPPGYPVWTIFTFLFTKLLPFSNIAWRVQVASAVAASLSCGFIALIVSRGSSMIIESIADLKEIDRRWENAICFVSGFVAALLLAFNGFMWSQAVIVEVYPFSVLSLMGVLCCLLRWMYAPQDRRYLYWAMFLYGICFTNHMTLIVAAMGVEVAIIAGSPKLGRDLLLWNVVIWIGGLVAKGSGLIHAFDTAPGANFNMVFVIFNAVGISSLAALIWLTVATVGLLSEWLTSLIMGICWLLGASFYFYMPLASLTNPPMNWGYPRTPEGFWHAFSRGQYEKTNPTDFIQHPLILVQQTINYFKGAIDEFTMVYLLLALVPFFFFFRMQKREKAWMTGLFGIFLCLAFLLMILLNPSPDRQAQSLNKVFFTASYVPVTIWIGYGLTIIAAWLLTHYERTRFWVITGAGLAVFIALIELVVSIDHRFEVPETAPGFGPLRILLYGASHLWDRGLGALPIWGSLLVLALALAFFLLAVASRTKIAILAVLSIFFCMPFSLVMSHWADNEQHGHLFGYWFGHDMFTPPFGIYPEMDRDAVLFGGTDPGRFCPTYMIYCESFIPPQDRRDPNFDRRDVYLITQNALADHTYLNYIRAQYFESAERDPTFFANFLPYTLPSVFHGPTTSLAWLDNIFGGLGAKIERERRDGTSFFKQADFKNVAALADKLRKAGKLATVPEAERSLNLAQTPPANEQRDPLAKYLYDQMSPETKSALDGKADETTVRQALVREFNKVIEGPSIYDPDRFKSVKLPVLIAQEVQANRETKLLPNTITRLNRRMLEEAFPEIARSPGGVFPDTEIYTPSEDDLQVCFNDYLQDAARRKQHDEANPGAPPQIRPGEDVQVLDGRVQVSGQTAVMSINGLLTKVIFDHNPNHEFYVEESFPLDWMYPYLTPFGVIMKINRQPVPELTQEIVDKDHKFWSLFAERLSGNWITYDTSIQEICDWAEKVYVHHDLSNLKGDPKFIRDDDAQKAFSKLRSSIGGIYNWRMLNARSDAEHQRALKEAEFAFKQAFAFCPYSPEAVLRYVTLLANNGRWEDALRIAQTCHKLDPYNGQITALADQLKGSVESIKKGNSPQVTLAALVSQVQSALSNHQADQAIAGLDQLLRVPQASAELLMFVAQGYLSAGQAAKAEEAIQRMTQLDPNMAIAWYHLAGLQAAQGKKDDSLANLKHALDLNTAQLQTSPNGLDLRKAIGGDHNFDLLRSSPEFQALVGTNN